MRNLIFALIVLFVANVASAAEIDRAYYLGNSEISYPVVIVQNSEVSAKINTAIRAEVTKILDSADSSVNDGTFNSVTVDVDYKIPCNHVGGVVSVVLTAFVNYERAAHPSTFCYGFNFNSETGERIFSDELNYTPEIVTEKLKKYAAQKGIYLSADFKGLNEVPQNFYYDDAMHVHFIFQQYEVAAYAVGIIDLDAATN